MEIQPSEHPLDTRLGNFSLSYDLVWGTKGAIKGSKPVQTQEEIN